MARGVRPRVCDCITCGHVTAIGRFGHRTRRGEDNDGFRRGRGSPRRWAQLMTHGRSGKKRWWRVGKKRRWREVGKKRPRRTGIWWEAGWETSELVGQATHDVCRDGRRMGVLLGKPQGGGGEAPETCLEGAGQAVHGVGEGGAAAAIY